MGLRSGPANLRRGFHLQTQSRVWRRGFQRRPVDLSQRCRSGSFTGRADRHVIKNADLLVNVSRSLKHQMFINFLPGGPARPKTPTTPSAVSDKPAWLQLERGRSQLPRAESSAFAGRKWCSTRSVASHSAEVMNWSSYLEWQEMVRPGVGDAPRSARRTGNGAGRATSTEELHGARAGRFLRRVRRVRS